MALEHSPDPRSAPATDEAQPFSYQQNSHSPQQRVPIAPYIQKDANTHKWVPQETSETEAAPSRISVLLWHLKYQAMSLWVASLSLVALVITLRECDQQPTPRWSLGPWAVTLNAIVSILSTLFRGTLLVPIAQTSVSLAGYGTYASGLFRISVIMTRQAGALSAASTCFAI